MEQLTITVLADDRTTRTNLIVRSSAGMLVAANNWPTVLRMVESDKPVRLSVRVAERLVGR